MSNSSDQHLAIAMIGDTHFAMPAAVTLTSLKKSKNSDSHYTIYFIDAGLNPSDKDRIMQLHDACFEICFIQPADDIRHLHVPSDRSIASANSSALFKFLLPDILPTLDRVLYLDSDMIFREDLSWLSNADFEGNLVMAVADSAQLYYSHRVLEKVENYFNSGFMLLNLAAFRAKSISAKLINIKARECTGLLVDQDAFNLTLEKQVKYLSIKYNCQTVNLARSARKVSVDKLNRLYGTDYKSLEEVFDDASVIHFASRDKPWKFSDVPFWETWIDAFSESPFYSDTALNAVAPRVSIIVPVYQIDKYLSQCLETLIRQTYQNIEIICINDGSTDRSAAIIAAYEAIDPRFVSITQSNMGQSAARNRGVEVARGDFIYFMDGDDLLSSTAIEELFAICANEQLDIVFFDAEPFYESSELEEQFGYYRSEYTRDMETTGVLSGGDMLKTMKEHSAYLVPPWVQFFRADFIRQNNLDFHEGIIYEDNIYSLRAILAAERCKYLSKILFLRRVREGSTMTSTPGTFNVKCHIVVASEVSKLASKSYSDTALNEICFTIVSQTLALASKVYIGLKNDQRAQLQFAQGSQESLFLNIVHRQTRVTQPAVRSLIAAGNLKMAVSGLLADIKQVRRNGEPIKSLKMLRQFREGARGVLAESILAETASVYRRMRNGMRKVLGLR